MIASVKHVYTNRPADRSGGATPRGGRPECLRETLFSMVHRKHKTNAAPSHYSVRKSAGHLQKRKSDKPGRAHPRQMEHRLVPASSKAYPGGLVHSSTVVLQMQLHIAPAATDRRKW